MNFYNATMIRLRLIEISPVVLERKIFQKLSTECIFTILQLLPLEDGCGPSFEQN